MLRHAPGFSPRAHTTEAARARFFSSFFFLNYALANNNKNGKKLELTTGEGEAGKHEPEPREEKRSAAADDKAARRHLRVF